MGDAFTVRISVRGDELDPQGHVNQAVYLQYAEHARWELLRAAGFTQEDLSSAGVGPVVLKATIRYQQELRAGDDVDVTCSLEWDDTKLVRLRQRFCRPDGRPVARLEGVIGLLDLGTRRLFPDPARRLRTMAVAPEVLGLPEQ